MSAPSGARAITEAESAGFCAVSSGPNGRYAPLRNETLHKLQHPDGRMLLLLTGPGGDFIRARALSRQWPVGVRRSAGSVPEMVKMLDPVAPTG